MPRDGVMVGLFTLYVIGSFDDSYYVAVLAVGLVVSVGIIICSLLGLAGYFNRDTKK